MTRDARGAVEPWDVVVLRWGSLSLAVLIVAFSGKDAYFISERRDAVVGLLGLAKLCLALGLWWLLHAVGTLLRALVRHEPHPVLRNPGYPLSFVLFAAWFGFWLYGLWPGLVASDAYGFIQMAEGLAIHAWYVYLQTFLYLTLFQLYPHVGVVGVFQVLLAAGVFAWVGGLLFERSRGAYTLFVLVLLVSPPVVANVISYHLDIIFSLLYVGVAFFVFRTVLRVGEGEARLEGRAAVGLAVAIAVLAVYRGEARFLIPLVPLVLGVGRSASLKTLGMMAAVSLGLFLLLAGPMARKIYALSGTSEVVEKQKTSYALTLRLNPLGYILQNPHVSRDVAAEEADLSGVVDVAKVKELSTLWETPVFWKGGWHQNMTSADFERFDKRFWQLVRDNPVLFLIGRLKTFLMGGGFFSEPAFYFTDYARRDQGARAMCRERCVDSVPEASPSPALYEKMIGLLDASIEPRGTSLLHGRFLFWNLLPALACVLAALLLVRWIPATAAAAFIVFARVPIVMLAAPASQFKYYLSLYLFGLLVPFLGFVELRSRSRRAAGLVPVPRWEDR